MIYAGRITLDPPSDTGDVAHRAADMHTEPILGWVTRHGRVYTRDFSGRVRWLNSVDDLRDVFSAEQVAELGLSSLGPEGCP